MIIRNTIAFTGAVAAELTPSLLVMGGMTFSPWFGAAAFTSILASLGGTMISGLLGLMILSAVIAILAYVAIQIQLAWLPV